MADRSSFRGFYVDCFLPEHQNRVNVGLHVLGTVASSLLVPWSLLVASPYWLLLWPLVHVAPGLVGHRLTERNALVGDLRVTRKDFSLVWFIAANHLLALQLLASAVGLARSPFAPASSRRVGRAGMTSSPGAQLEDERP